MTSLPVSDPGSAAAWGSKRINPRPQSCLCLTWSGYPLNDDDDTKTVTIVFHLNNIEAKCELKFCNNDRHLPFCPTPTYLGLKLAYCSCFITLSSSFEGHPLQARHKQNWGQGFIFLLPQTAALPGSDTGSDVIKPASSFAIQNHQTACFMWCLMYGAHC